MEQAERLTGRVLDGDVFDGDAINALLCGCGVNLRLLIGVIYLHLYFLLFSVRQNLERHARSTLAAYSVHHKAVYPPFGPGFSLY